MRRRSKVHQIVQMLRMGQFSPLAAQVRRWIHHDDEGVVWRRPIDVLPLLPSDFSVRELSIDDEQLLLDAAAEDDAWDATRRVRLLPGPGRTFGAFEPTGELVATVSLLDGRTREDIIEFFGQSMPPMEPNELCVEAGWTHPDYRGHRLNGQLVNAGAAVIGDHDTLVTSTSLSYPPTTRANLHQGYTVTHLRHEHWRLGYARIEYEVASPEFGDSLRDQLGLPT